MTDLSIFVDQAGALAVIALLSTAYGSIWRHFNNQAHASLILGAFFGFAAILQMHAPLEVSDGVILDLRCIPIALSGAFLGIRGLAMSLAIAIGARFQIGGIGWVAGSIGMIIAGGAGLAWAFLTSSMKRRNLKSLLCLALIMSAHLLGAFWLPWNSAVWFIANAAPFFIGLNLLAIPLVGSLLEREIQLAQSEQTLRNTSRVEPSTQMLHQDAFLKDLVHRRAASSPGCVSGIMVLTIRRRKQFLRLLGQECLDTALGAIRVRLADLMTHGYGAGITSDGRILVALSADEIRAGDSWQVILCRSIRDNPITLTGSLPIRVMLSHEIIETTELDIIEEHLDFSRSKVPLFLDEVSLGSNVATINFDEKQVLDPQSAQSPNLDVVPSLSKDLFAKAELLMVRH